MMSLIHEALGETRLAACPAPCPAPISDSDWAIRVLYGDPASGT